MSYNDERVEGMKTLGDAYAYYSDDFVVGVHWILDHLLGEVELLGVPVDEMYLDQWAARMLARAKARQL